jgi:hypothetical protein
LLQQLEERNTLDEHLHHDNAILQEKVNSLQQLVDKMTKTNCNLREQLKQHKRHKTKYLGQDGEASKANPFQQVYSYGAIHFCLQWDLQNLTCGVMLGS